MIEEVGQGGMAVVLRAHDDTLKREVAVKVLHAHLLAEPESKARLEREAQAVAKLQHDNIVQIFDYSGKDAAASYIVTEYIEGQTLKQFVAGRRALPPDVAALIALEIGCALRHAHSFGIIHRDVKPENVMVRKDGLLKLMDFGVAQIMDLERMTVTGQLLGSPAYMAPEILEGKLLDVRTDVFSVGIMLYQLATGALPFSGRNPHEVLKRIAEGKFPDPRTINRLVDDRLGKIIARALARRPEDRYPTISALVDDLTAFLKDAGLEHPREELQAFFTDPDRYERELPPRMLAALIAAGQRARAEKKTARALELWNRALTLDPRNGAVLAELKRLEGRQHLRRAALAVAGAAALAAIGVLALRSAGDAEIAPASGAGAGAGKAGLAASTSRAAPAAERSPPESQRRASSPEGSSVAPQAGQPPAGETGQEESRGAARAPAPKASAAPRPAPSGGAPALRRLTVVSPNLKNFQVYVDGQLQRSFDPFTNSVLELTWDRDHDVRFTSPICCEDYEVKVGPSTQDTDGPLVPRWRGHPAEISVATLPPSEGALLVHELGPEGRPTGRGRPGRVGETIHISFDGDADLHKNLEITLLDSPGGHVKKSVGITAGTRHAISVRLND